MKISKNELLKSRNDKTLQTYKNNQLFVGDVWQNEFGTKSIVYFLFLPDGSKKYILLKENGVQHMLPEEKAGFGDAERIGNVCDNEDLMKIFVEKNIIIEEDKKMEEKQEKKKATKKQDEKQEKMCLMAKINKIRIDWSEQNIEKEGLGKAGGGAKYEYYKPQQIIDFCLSEENKYGLFSDFDTVRNEDGLTTHCFYKVTDINSKETKEVSCPFEIPTKMAASQAQQVGAALTYYNRRLAMLMYKIEDNSKESVEVLNNADYSALNAPEIPAPPIDNDDITPPTIIPPVITPPTTPPPTVTFSNVPPKPPVIDLNADKKIEVQQVSPPQKNPISFNSVAENEQKNIPTPPPINNSLEGLY